MQNNTKIYQENTFHFGVDSLSCCLQKFTEKKKGRVWTMTPMKWFLTYLKQYRPRIIFGLVLVTAMAALAIVSPNISGEIVPSHSCQTFSGIVIADSWSGFHAYARGVFWPLMLLSVLDFTAKGWKISGHLIETEESESYNKDCKW